MIETMNSAFRFSASNLSLSVCFIFYAWWRIWCFFCRLFSFFFFVRQTSLLFAYTFCFTTLFPGVCVCVDILLFRFISVSMCDVPCFELYSEWNAYQYKIYGGRCNRNLYIHWLTQTPKRDDTRIRLHIHFVSERAHITIASAQIVLTTKNLWILKMLPLICAF